MAGNISVSSPPGLRKTKCQPHLSDNIHHNMDDLAECCTPLSSLTQKYTLKYVRCTVFRFGERLCDSHIVCRRTGFVLS